MAFTLPNAPYKSEWASPYPDIRQAINGGIMDSLKPREQAEKLVQSMLASKINAAKAKYAQQMEQANLNHILAQTHSVHANEGLLPLRQQLLQAQINSTMNPYQKEAIKQQATQDIKNINEGEENIPQAEQLLKKIDEQLEVIARHKEWFGPATPGLGLITGPNARKRSIQDEEYGPLEALFGQLVGPQAQELSHGNKVLATALNLAQGIKPGLDENQPIAYGKLKKIRNELYNSIQLKKHKYEKSGGQQRLGEYKGFQPRTYFKSKDEFHEYMKQLTPHQRNLVTDALKGK